MIKRRVYIETSVISYLTARPSKKWNCKHIANPEIQARIAENFRVKGLFLPFICTPEELIGEYENE